MRLLVFLFFVNNAYFQKWTFRAAQHIICEQEWVTDTMYRIITTNRMEALNHERLKMGSIVRTVQILYIEKSNSLIISSLKVHISYVWESLKLIF